MRFSPGVKTASRNMIKQLLTLKMSLQERCHGDVSEICSQDIGTAKGISWSPSVRSLGVNVPVLILYHSMGITMVYKCLDRIIWFYSCYSWRTPPSPPNQIQDPKNKMLNIIKSSGQRKQLLCSAKHLDHYFWVNFHWFLSNFQTYEF